MQVQINDFSKTIKLLEKEWIESKTNYSKQITISNR